MNGSWVSYVLGALGILLYLAWPLLAVFLLPRLMAACRGLPTGPFTSNRRGFLPLYPSSPSWTTRLSEAVMLACMGLVTLVLAATTRHAGGLLTMLDQLRPPFARVNVIVAACAAGGVLVGALVCLLWRTTAGTVLVGLVLCAYGIMINGPGSPMVALTPDRGALPKTEYVITLGGGDFAGAELWVNDVFVGRTPVVTTLGEFREKVPWWPEPPEDYTDPDNEVRVVEDFRIGGGWSGTQHERLIRLTIPEQPEGPYRNHRPAPAGARRDKDEHGPRTYYARIKLAGEWGTGRQSSGGGSGGRYTYRAHTVIQARFPQREKRLEALLDRGRLAGYEVGTDWFEAIETYGMDGAIALRTAPDWQTHMSRVLDAWARWRYDLEEATVPDAAWRAFLRICREADRERRYSTAGVAGRAVELLVPRLDPERLARQAVEVIRRGGRINYLRWELSGRLHFGHSARSDGLRTGANQIHYRTEGGPGELPPSGYAVAHAVWLLDARQASPDIVEMRVVPQIIRTYHGQDHAMLAAAHLGGPVVEEFLTRQDWRAPVEPGGENHMWLGGSGDVNRWLYLLAHLMGDPGAKFRTDHYGEIAELADKLTDKWHEELPDFLFTDLDRGKRSPAARYWPRFLHRAGELGYHGPGQCMEYLVRMEPLSGVEQYVDAWRQTVDYGDFTPDGALRQLRRLPPAKQREVLNALIEQVETDLKQAADGDRGDYALRKLRSALHEVTDETFARRWMGILREDARNRERYLESVTRWLSHDRPEHPLVRMLARAEAPELRAMVPPVLASHPSPEHRDLLENLLEDPDPAVRRSAEKAQSEIEALRTRPLIELAMPDGRQACPGSGPSPADCS